MKARENALIILNKYAEKGVYANLELKKMLKGDERENAFATELVYGVIRYMLRLDYVINRFSKIKKDRISLSVRNILRISAYQLLFLDKVPVSAICNEGTNLAKKYSNAGGASFVNGLLRTLSREKDKIVYPNAQLDNLIYYYSFPSDIAKIFLRDYGYNNAKTILSELNKNKGICVRPNLLKISADEFEELFKDSEFEKGEGCYYFKSLLVNKSKEFDEGLYTVQDRASMMCVELLAPKPDDKILDLCSAPGGKACYMAELMENKGSILACDIHPHRTELIEKNAKRLGVDIIETMVNDAETENQSFVESFDKVLIDAPCSGLGVIAKKPDIKWSEKNFDSLTKVQYNILVNGSRYVKKGGCIVYSTCTINKDENENIIAKFLEENKNFVKASEEIQLMPCKETDGFFMCRLERIF